MSEDYSCTVRMGWVYRVEISSDGDVISMARPVWTEGDEIKSEPEIHTRPYLEDRSSDEGFEELVLYLSTEIGYTMWKDGVEELWPLVWEEIFEGLIPFEEVSSLLEEKKSPHYKGDGNFVYS